MKCRLLPSNWYMNQHKNKLFIFYKNPIFWNVLLFELADQYEFLTGKEDDICRKFIKKEYFTFVRLEM